MKALNKQERNSAILKFSLWLLICVLIICVPILLTGFLPHEQQTVNTKEKEDLTKEVNFEKDYIATKIQEIKDLMDEKNANEVDADVFNAKLMSINTEISERSNADTSWRGAMYRNIADISEYIISANKIKAKEQESKEKEQEKQVKQGENIDSQVKELAAIITKLENCKVYLDDLNNQNKKKDLAKGVSETLYKVNEVLSMLKTYKEGLK